MRYFESLDAIRQASVEQLRIVPGMNERSARAVRDFFERQQEKQQKRDAEQNGEQNGEKNGE